MIGAGKRSRTSDLRITNCSLLSRKLLILLIFYFEVNNKFRGVLASLVVFRTMAHHATSRGLLF